MRLTIYRKLLIFILPIVCLSILGVGYYSYLIARGETVKQIKSQIQRQAEDVAAKIARLNNQARIDLITISELTSIADYYSNREYELYNEAEICRKAVERFMLRFSDRSKVYVGVSYIDEKGIEIAKVINNRIAPRYKDRSKGLYFKETRGLKKGDIYVSNVGMGEDGEALIVRHATPIFNDSGEFKGIVTLNLDFNRIQDSIKGIKIGKSSRAYLLDSEGIVLTPPGSESIMISESIAELNKITEVMVAGKEGWRGYSTEGGDRLVASVPVGASGWSVAIIAPFSDFMGGINRIKIYSTLLTLFALLISIFGVLVIASGISNPIKKLADFTKIVSNGKFDHQVHVRSRDEVGELAISFNEMTKKLKTSQEEIKGWNRELKERVMRTSGELVAEKEKLEAVFHSMADGVVVIDKFSRVIDLNPAAERLIGEKKSVLTGHQILMKQEESEGDVSPGIKNLQIIGGVKFEEEYLKCWEHFKCEKEGCPAYKSEEWRCWLMPDTHCHAPDGILENFETKAERCSNCELLTRIKEEYNPAKETESREVAIDIPRRDIRVFKTPMFDSGDSFLGNVMVLQDITKENEIDKMKSEFVSTVSHELRTPLSSIKSFAELLLDDLDTLDIETQKKFLGIINNESDRLTRLISGLLDLQKMTSNKMKWNMENIQLSQVVKSCVETFSSLGNKKNIDLNYECDDQLPLVYGDRDKLQQVLYNLISNALKFNEKRGKKKEKVKVEARNDHRGVMITVSDTGIGIPEEKLDMIFERFYQVDSSNTRKTEGTGLGLAICKEIIDCHGGGIWVNSEIGKGSKFSFIIPRVATEKAIFDPRYISEREAVGSSIKVGVATYSDDGCAIDELVEGTIQPQIHTDERR